MNWARSLPLAAALVLAAPLVASPVAGHAMTQVAGPVQIGPSTADGDAQNRSATLATTLLNQGGLPDRLVNVACPGVGTVALTDGHVQPISPGSTEQRNGLDLPGAVGGNATAVQARFALTDASQPMTQGALVPCALYFEHAGQRIVIFSLGVHETATNEP